MESLPSPPIGEPASTESYPVLDSEFSPFLNMSSSDEDTDANADQIIFTSGISKVAHRSADSKNVICDYYFISLHQFYFIQLQIALQMTVAIPWDVPYDCISHL
jgi:hypothetical protein